MSGILGILYVVTRYFMGALYTPEWAARNIFWMITPVILFPTLFHKTKFSVSALTGYLLGLLAGEIFGGFASDVPPQYSHFGWCILLVVFAISCIAGGLYQKHQTPHDK